MRLSSSPLLLLLLLLALLLLAPRTVHAAIGDKCGVVGSDFLDDTFTGQYRVAGEGCTIGDETDCYCSPILGDEDQFGEWIWQCNSQSSSASGLLVPFGPTEGKECPSEIPVRFGFDGSVNENPICDISKYPNGQVGDPPCTYSDCAEGGSQSAVCGCIDEALGSGAEETDFRWYCLHATCNCSSANTKVAVLMAGGPLIATVMALLFSL